MAQFNTPSKTHHDTLNDSYYLSSEGTNAYLHGSPPLIPRGKVLVGPNKSPRDEFPLVGSTSLKLMGELTTAASYDSKIVQKSEFSVHELAN
jgi:hypothetical protein